LGDLEKDQEFRNQLFRSLLRRFGLKTSETIIEQPPLTKLAIVSENKSQETQLWDSILSVLTKDLSITSDVKDVLQFSKTLEDNTVTTKEENDTTYNLIPVSFVSSLSQAKFDSFDSDTFFRLLKENRKVKGGEFGSLLMYTDVITSTQTILEKYFFFFFPFQWLFLSSCSFL